MSKIGILGGTFDPIHIGHLITALSVKEIRNLDKILFIPAYISPHKLNVKSVSPEHRLKMVQLAIEDVPYFECSTIEIESSSVSYTVDTIKRLKQQYENLELVIGYDNIVDFNTWKDPDEILDLVKLVVMKRELSKEPEIMDKYYNSAIFVQTPTIEISSSEIRERILKGLTIDFLVPLKVKNYIYKHKLYKEDKI